MITKIYEGEECWLGYSEIEGLFFLHTEIKGKWSLSRYKLLLNILVHSLKSINASYLYSTVTEETKKFNELFGFEEVLTVEGTSIMRLKNVWFS